MHPLWQLFITRMREFYREPEVLFWVYGFPLILAVVLGIAFWDRKPEPVAVDVQAGPQADDLKEHLTRAGLVAEVHDEAECRQRLRTGKSALFVVKDEGGVRYVFDRARPESQATRAEVNAAVTSWQAGVTASREGETEQYSTSTGQTWLTTDEPVTEAGSRYIDFLVPGLMGMNIMGGGLFGIGFGLVDMRVRKLLKRFLATPMRRDHFLLSILGSRLVMLIPEMGLLIALAVLAFGVPIRGNPLTLAVVILVGAFAFCGIGLLVASRTEKTETVSGLINLIALPGWILSGTFFSSKRFPDVVQPFIQALPLTQLNDALREVMLEGATLSHVGWRLAILAAWGTVPFLLALKLFRWR